MTTLKEKIYSDFVVAYKAKDENAKSALSSIKAKITEAEKANGNKELTDDGILKVLNSAIKQRNQSYEAFNDAGREDLSRKEYDEMLILKAYLPTQMNETQIELKVREIIQSMEGTVTNPTALIGKTMGAFNKLYNGQADSKMVMTIINKIVKP
jgi:uncharacterized protein YqeY